MRYIFTVLFICFSFYPSLAQSDYYWVGDGGNWSDLGHWATSSGGSTFHTELPGEDDNVFFDNLSFSLEDQEVSLDVDGYCLNLDWTGATHSPYFRSLGSSNENILYLYGSIAFNNSVEKRLHKMVFRSADNGNVIHSGETTMGSTSSMIFEGTGEWSLQDSLAVGWMRCRGLGTLNTNNHPVHTNYFLECNSAGTLNAGSSTFYLDLGIEIIEETFNFHEGTSTLIITEGNRFRGSDNIFHNLLVKNNASLFVQGNNTFNEFKAESGANITFESGSEQTVNALDLVGGKSSPVDINTNLPGSPATLSKSSGTVNASFLILQDINATGGATFNAQNSIDNGNNTGWNITPYNGLDYYWVGGNGIWDDVNHWAKTNGGNTFYTEPPGVLDNVFFNNASGGAETTVTLTDVNLAANLTFSNLPTNFVIQGSGNELQVYGALVLDDALNLSAQVRMQSSEIESVTFNDAHRLLGIIFDGSGTFNLADDITAENFFLYRGTLNTNNKVINAPSQFFIKPETEADRSDYIRFNGGTSSIYTSYFTTDQYWIHNQNITSDEVNLTETTIHLLENTSKSILGGGLVFNNIIFSSGTTNVYGSINGGIVANTITVLPGTELLISPEEEDAVLFETLVAEGTESDPIEFRSLITGEQAYFKSTSGTAFEGIYLEIQDMNASGTTFTAEESVDLGNNTGWNISSTKQNQTITFQDIPDKTFGDGDFELNVSASSGLEVLLTTSSPNIEINGKTVTITGGGSATIRARQPGNDNYNAAAEVYKTFMVNKASQTISFDGIDDMDIEEITTINLNATATSDLPVTFSVVAGPASVDGNALIITGTGNITVRATQAGDGNYAAATFVDQTFEVTGNVTGIDALDTSFKLYPNPTQHQFVLENGGQDIKELYLVNANGGRRIIRFPKTKHITFGEDLAAGIWILEVHTAQGVYYRKLIKQ